MYLCMGPGHLQMQSAETKSTGLGWTWCPYKKKGHTEVTRGRECHMETEAETGEMQPHAKECRGLVATTGSWDRSGGRTLPQALPQTPTPTAPSSQTPGLQNRERTNLCCFKATTAVIICYSLPGRRIQSPCSPRDLQSHGQRGLTGCPVFCGFGNDHEV